MNCSQATSPLLASPQGGEGCVIKKLSAATQTDAAGVVFLFLLNRKTTPSSRPTELPRHFMDRSATPPCGGARRGIGALRQFIHAFIDRACSSEQHPARLLFVQSPP